MIRQSRADDLGQLQQLFRLSFGEAGSGPVFAPAVLRWKYWESGDSRSFIDERDGGIVSHACAWPLILLTGQAQVRGMHCIDWAANPAYPGAGIAVFEVAGKTASFQIGAGGSEITHKLRPALGFRERGRIGIYARVLAPLRHALTHPAKDWRLPGRVVRSLLQPGIGPVRWQAELMDPARPQTDFPYPAPLPGILPFARNQETLAAWSRCPAARFLVFRATRDKTEAGYFCLTFTPGQARIADAWTPSEDPADWALLYQLAAHTAAQQHGSYELRAEAVPDCCRQGLAMAGFRLRREEPLMLRDRRRILPDEPALHFQPIDGDGAFWHSGAPDYLL